MQVLQPIIIQVPVVVNEKEHNEIADAQGVVVQEEEPRRVDEDAVEEVDINMEQIR